MSVVWVNAPSRSMVPALGPGARLWWRRQTMTPVPPTGRRTMGGCRHGGGARRIERCSGGAQPEMRGYGVSGEGRRRRRGVVEDVRWRVDVLQSDDGTMPVAGIRRQSRKKEVCEDKEPVSLPEEVERNLSSVRKPAGSHGPRQTAPPPVKRGCQDPCASTIDMSARSEPREILDVPG